MPSRAVTGMGPIIVVKLTLLSRDFLNSSFFSKVVLTVGWKLWARMPSTETVMFTFDFPCRGTVKPQLASSTVMRMLARYARTLPLPVIDRPLVSPLVSSFAAISTARMFLRPRGNDHDLVVPSGMPPRFPTLLLGLFFRALWTASTRFLSFLAEAAKRLAMSSRLANLVLCLVGSYANSCFFRAAL